MVLATYRATVPGLIIRHMVSVGYRGSALTGRLIDRVNGCGYRPQVGHGCPVSRGDGRHITTVVGHTFPDWAGPGYRASVRQIAGMVIEITIGVLRLFSSSTVRLLGATTSD